MRKIAIFGPGLLGGSIALKLRALGGWHIGLWARRAAALDDLRARGLADLVSSDIEEIARDADLVVLCVPVEAMGALAREIARFAPPSCIVTDVGSVKGCVDAELAPIFAGKCRYVGSHPMAGKAEAGIAAAEAGLFAGANCIITTPDPDVQAFWEILGCRVVTMTAREHDECVALISHLPHLVAGNLVRAVAEKNACAFEVVGPGFRDTTRVASGPPELWTGILQANRPAVLEAIDAMISKLADFRKTLAQTDNGAQLHQALAEAKQTRDGIWPLPPK